MFYIVKHHKKYKKILLAILLIIIMDMLNVYFNFNNLSFICLTYWSRFDAHVERDVTSRVDEKWSADGRRALRRVEIGWRCGLRSRRSAWALNLR